MNKLTLTIYDIVLILAALVAPDLLLQLAVYVAVAITLLLLWGSLFFSSYRLINQVLNNKYVPTFKSYVRAWMQKARQYRSTHNLASLTYWRNI